MRLVYPGRRGLQQEKEPEPPKESRPCATYKTGAIGNREGAGNRYDENRKKKICTKGVPGPCHKGSLLLPLSQA
jgi:hypothetical protein